MAEVLEAYGKIYIQRFGSVLHQRLGFLEPPADNPFARRFTENLTELLLECRQAPAGIMGESFHIQVAGKVGIHECRQVNLEGLVEVEQDTPELRHNLHQRQDDFLDLGFHQRLRRLHPGIEPAFHGLEHPRKDRMLREHHIRRLGSILLRARQIDMVFGERFLQHRLFQLQKEALERRAVLGRVLDLMGLMILPDQVGLPLVKMMPALIVQHIQLSLNHIHQHMLLYHGLEFLLLVNRAAEESLHIIVELYSGFKHGFVELSAAKVSTFFVTMVFSTVFFTLLRSFSCSQ